MRVTRRRSLEWWHIKPATLTAPYTYAPRALVKREPSYQCLCCENPRKYREKMRPQSIQDRTFLGKLNEKSSQHSLQPVRPTPALQWVMIGAFSVVDSLAWTIFRIKERNSSGDSGTSKDTKMRQQVRKRRKIEPRSGQTVKWYWVILCRLPGLLASDNSIRRKSRSIHPENCRVPIGWTIKARPAGLGPKITGSPSSVRIWIRIIVQSYHRANIDRIWHDRVRRGSWPSR